jgi:hypothetical protein
LQNLENLQGASQGDDRAREVEKHAEHERSLLKVEIGRLQALVDDSQTAKRETAASVSSSAAEATQLRAELAELKSDFKTALDDNDDLLQQVEDLKAKAADTDGLEALHDQQTKNIELRDKVRDLQKELEAARAAASAGGAAAGVDRDSSDLGRRVEAGEEENRLLLAEVEDLREVRLPPPSSAGEQRSDCALPPRTTLRPSGRSRSSWRTRSWPRSRSSMGSLRRTNARRPRPRSCATLSPRPRPRSSRRRSSTR